MQHTSDDAHAVHFVQSAWWQVPPHGTVPQHRVSPTGTAEGQPPLAPSVSAGASSPAASTPASGVEASVNVTSGTPQLQRARTPEAARAARAIRAHGRMPARSLAGPRHL